MGVLGAKIGEGVVRYWPQRTRSYFSGFLRLYHFFVKIDQEMRPWECSQTDRQTDRQTDTHTHTQTQTDFIICPMLYAIAMGQIISNGEHVKPTLSTNKLYCHQQHLPNISQNVCLDLGISQVNLVTFNWSKLGELSGRHVLIRTTGTPLQSMWEKFWLFWNFDE